MKLVGQFNLGFILVSLSKDGCNNLFIIDQHASDEKYNFERLITNFEINYQSLVQPQTVELSIIDEILVIDNKSVFERNGFKFEIDEEQKCGKRIKLTAIPYSKGHTFNMQDFNELINLLNDNGNNRDIKCQKIRSLCAMKACRSLIMIGQSLLENTMTRVVENLSKLNKPWNCPHGRPTMRHLIELNHWKASNFPDYKI
jgi:DNA mismatch repair protein PMS2